MHFYLWQGEALSQQNHLGILEPCPQKSPLKQANQDSLICVPALCIDKKGIRVGYGGGYYDRFLAKYPQATTMGVVYHSHLCSKLPMDAWDIPLDYICTEKGIIKT